MQSYDWNGRPEVTTNTNGTTKSVSYGGCGCAGSNAMTITDESGRQKKVIYDVLGRVRKTQVLNSGGNVYSTQVNTWNVRDQVTYSRQYSGDPADVSTCPSNACLETAMLYDGHGRKASNKRPDESMATSYEYHDDDTLKKVTDARGAYASFTYWGRPLVKDITYNKPSGVGDTNSVYFEYDGASNRTLMIEKVPNTDPDPNQRCGPSRECGRTTYSYDQQSRMQWELRTFYGLSGSYKLTYDYNLSGQLKQLGYESSNFAMDNNTIYYGHDKAGNLTSVTGTPFAGVTTYAAGMQYRAWGAVKSLSYGNGITFSANYNKRLQMQTFEIAKTGSPTMMKADFQYYGDGRIKYAKDYRDDRFDRAFSYDQVGRIQEAYAGSQARGFMGLPDPNPATPPYRQSYQYDVWGNTTGSSGKFWSRDYTSTDSYNPNGQRQGWQYDGAGNLLNDSRNQYIYDAAGRNISVTANGQNPKAQSLDGDGLVIRQVNYTQLPNPACYYLRSTVLGGVTVIKINGTDNGPGFLSVGRVTGETIYAGDAEIATQTTYANGSISLSWTHLNPVTNSKGHSFASGEYFTDIEPDPTGAYLGLTEPVSNPDPPPSGGEGIPLFLLPTGGDPWVKVTVDGVEVPWAEAQRLIGMGIATRAPENLFAPVVWHGERTLAKWQSFADGYQGYVPIGACYGGDGVLTRCGNGKPQLYCSYHSGLRDNVAAINGATGEAELGYSLSFGLQQGGGPRSQTQSQTPTPQGNCATPNSLINDPEHKKLFEALWDRTMASGEENGAAIFYESVTNTYHKIKLSEGEHMKVLSTDKQRVVYEVPTMPNAGREMKAALNNFAAEKRDVLFMAFFHTHPNYKSTGNSRDGEPSGFLGDANTQEDFRFPLGIIRTGDGYFFFMGFKSFRSDDPRANKCIWELIKEKRQQ
ncbi:MAG: hypothetical protein HONDAALG_04397 [Gammaproteobacteria bacterium]|nr:hypothetical protein [Gammaproteobacteria bacterium]